eukprot:97043-Pleurochrysis_carterae.AAC.3
MLRCWQARLRQTPARKGSLGLAGMRHTARKTRRCRPCAPPQWRRGSCGRSADPQASEGRAQALVTPGESCISECRLPARIVESWVLEHVVGAGIASGAQQSGRAAHQFVRFPELARVAFGHARKAGDVVPVAYRRRSAVRCIGRREEARNGVRRTRGRGEDG